MDTLNLSFFLTHGYFNTYHSEKWKINFIPDYSFNFDLAEESELVKKASDLFLEEIGKHFIPWKKNAVPLSGGLDSRLILAALMTLTTADNIHTYTFGSPGTYDFELGSGVANTAGTKHRQFRIDNYLFSEDELLEISRRVDIQTLLFHHGPVKQIDENFADHTIWSGYIGDLIAGGHLRNNSSKTPDEAKQHYLEQRRIVRSLNLAPINPEKYMDKIENPIYPGNFLSLDEQVLLDEGCQKFTAPHVLMKGYSYVTPFINNSWMNFMLQLPKKHRLHKKLYKKMLTHINPKLFSLGVKDNYGLVLFPSAGQLLRRKIASKWKWYRGYRINKKLNYMDFNYQIRNNDSLKLLITNSIADLEDRRIIDWFSPAKILKEHIHNRGNYADALITLSSLEFHLKNGKVL